MINFHTEPNGATAKSPAKTKPTATIPPPEALIALEKSCLEFEDQAAKLDAMIAALETDLDEVRRNHMPALKRQAGVRAAREAAVVAAIEAAPELFVKPRTAVLHGVKVGYKFNEGRLGFDDAQDVVKAIKRHFKDRVEDLIRTKEEPNKDALGRLPASDLARLGCRIEGVGDGVVLKRVAGDVEKLFEKLIEKMVESITEG